jgi:citronellol/citronellal dehydrogenase
VTCGRRLEPLRETVALGPAGAVEAIACDIREEAEVDALVDQVLERHGQIDLLVNNAGGQFLSPAEDITPKGFRTVIRLNLEGTWLMTHAVATRAFIPSGGGGKVISVTLTPHAGLPGMAHSSAARAGVENLMKVLAIEWARFGIRPDGGRGRSHRDRDVSLEIPPGADRDPWSKHPARAAWQARGDRADDRVPCLARRRLRHRHRDHRRRRTRRVPRTLSAPGPHARFGETGR